MIHCCPQEYFFPSRIGNFGAKLICDSKEVGIYGCDLIITPPASVGSPVTLSMNAWNIILSGSKDQSLKVHDALEAWAKNNNIDISSK